MSVSNINQNSEQAAPQDAGEQGPRPNIMGRTFQISEQTLANDRIDALPGIAAAMVRGSIEAVRKGLT